MHELAVMESVVDAVLEQTGDQRIVAVRLVVGQLAGVDVEALRFSFDVCTRDTTLAGARLDITMVSGRSRCRTCAAEQVVYSLVAPCGCGSFDRDLLTGDELRLEEVELA